MTGSQVTLYTIWTECFYCFTIEYIWREINIGKPYNGIIQFHPNITPLNILIIIPPITTVDTGYDMTDTMVAFT